MQPLSHSAPAHRRLTLASVVALTGLAATVMIGCGQSPRIDDKFHPRLTDPARRHPIVVAAETATLDIEVPPSGKGDEARAYIETTRFMRNYRHEGQGPIRIAVPRRDEGAVYRQVQALRLAAHRAGIPAQRLRVTETSEPGTIRLAYDRVAAIGPTCGDWSEDVARNPEFLPYANYGCASQRNIAAMAANPTDLMYPAQERPRGSDTRATDAKNFKDNLGKMIPSSPR